MPVRDTAHLAQTLALDADRVVPVQLDLTSQESISAAAQKASGTRLLINNAGRLTFGGALDVSEAGQADDMAVNHYGTWNVTRSFAPVIAANGGGAVVNMLSLLSFVSAPGFSGYNASKAAAWSMAMSLRPYLQSEGIRVINAFPGGIDTDMLAGVDGPKDAPDVVARDVLAAVARGDEDVYPGAAAEVFASWRADQKGVESAFAQMM